MNLQINDTVLSLFIKGRIPIAMTDRFLSYFPYITMLNRLTLTDIFIGISHGVWHSRKQLFRSYVIVPFGIVLILGILYGLNELLTKVIKIKFPASVLGMLINLILLCLLSYISTLESSGKHIDRLKAGSGWVLANYLRLIQPSMNFTLIWINVVFIPSFIVLPLSEPIKIIECLKIAAVFVIGLVALFCVDVYMVIGFRWLLNHFGVYSGDTVHREEQLDDEVDPRTPDGSERVTDLTTIELHDMTPASPVSTSRPGSLFVGPSIPQPPPTYGNKGAHYDQEVIRTFPVRDSPLDSPNSHSRKSSIDVQQSSIQPNENQQKIILFITEYIDWILYSTLLLSSIPFYYVTAVRTFLPYHLALTILSYRVALLIPEKWPLTKKFAHPILISTGMILFICFIGSLIYHRGKPGGFLGDLMFFKTGRTYLYLFDRGITLDSGKYTSLRPENYTATPRWPGCGDVLASVMDVSIVALSLPMFTHRRDFIKNFWILMPPIIASIGLTFFIYPIAAHGIGIEAARSIGFIGRSVTLALGIPLVNSLKGSVSLAAVTTVLSGIIGVLVEEPVFRLLRVPANDYVTRGVSLGINSGAIGTAHLLKTNPRAASMSSLSFSAFGTVMIVLASIGPIRDLIQSLVGWN